MTAPRGRMSDTPSESAQIGPRVAAQAGEKLARPRVAVVLAAGRSERLADVTGGGSKALVRVGGLSLAGRAVRRLLATGIERVIVVVGYQAGPVATVVNRIAPGRARAVFADHWERGNGASLAAADPHLAEERSFLLVTTDHVFGEGALEPLLSSSGYGVLVDHAPDPKAWAEGTRVRLHEEHAIAFSKEFEDPSIDCGAFLLPVAIFEAQRRAAASGDESLAGAVTELARTVPLEALPLPQGAWWQDVDTRADLRRAAERLRRSLTKDADGPVARYFNRPVSTRLSMALARLPLHPDVVSLIAFLVTLAGAWSLAMGAGVAGGLLVHAGSLLDGVDGEIARLQVRASPAGALLDGVLDRLADACVIGALALWAIEAGTDPSVAVALAVAATTGAMLSMATKDRITALGLPSAPERSIGFVFGGRDARLLIVTVFAILGRPSVALASVAITSGASLAIRLYLTRRVVRGQIGRR
jgi:1L-myo-inositol 1-phosphate cytidylyltransferase / CDP-L-myo-inositol myo-inositolphosphotransferase